VRAWLALVAFAACGNPAQDIIGSATRFRDRMCACKDQACIDSVDDEQKRWDATEREKLRANAESSADYFTQEKAARDQGDDCRKHVEKSLAPSPIIDAAVPDAPVDAAAPDALQPLPPATPIDITAAIRDARAWAMSKRNGTLGYIGVDYIGSDGVLDADDGEIQLHFGIGPVDDPSRKTGKPVKHPDFSPQCFSLVLAHAEWKAHDVTCDKTFIEQPTCTPVDVWKRALADTHDKDGLTKDALAVIELSAAGTLHEWTLRVDDDLRKVHIFRAYPDDCAVSVEKPTK
jgi:hypothetical protein